VHTGTECGDLLAQLCDRLVELPDLRGVLRPGLECDDAVLERGDGLFQAAAVVEVGCDCIEICPDPAQAGVAG
jgi:hypothetical protein